jgi:hypothetical protein
MLFKAFGLSPLGYHLVNAAALASIALMLYLVLRDLGVHSTVALAVPAVYILLPNYSTDRFWFAAFGYALSMALFLLSTYAFLRAARSQFVLPWILVALVALAAAALGMEVVIPLTLVVPIALWVRSNRLFPGGLWAQLGASRTVLLVCSPLAVVVLVVIYKAGTAGGIRVPDFFYVVRLAIGSLAVNFGTFGVALPHTVVWGLRHLSLGSIALGAILATLVFSYLWTAEAPPESGRVWTKIVMAGATIFLLGTAIFLTTRRISFWSTGIANRVWIAAALGAALVLVGASGWVSSRLSTGARRSVFSGLVACLCLCGFVVNTALSTFWTAAWPRQVEVLGHIGRALPELPSGTTVMLYGVCPYLGPAIVFESPWDLAGALQVLYRDSTLLGDVIVDGTDGRFTVAEQGLWTQIYGDWSFYPYRRDLLLFDYRRGATLRLTDGNIARAHLSERTGCPGGVEGRGTPALPVDMWYHITFSPWR